MIIAIGNTDFDVNFVENLNDDGNTLMGQVVYADREIQIDKGICLSEQHVILWHEVLHVICHQTAIELTEKEVTALAYQITAALENNDELQSVDSFNTAKDED